MKIGYIGSLKWGKKEFLQTAVLGYIFIYVQIKYEHMIPYMYLTIRVKNLSHKNMWYNYCTKIIYRKGQADPDNQRPDKWISTVLIFFVTWLGSPSVTRPPL